MSKLANLNENDLITIKRFSDLIKNPEQLKSADPLVVTDILSQVLTIILDMDEAIEQIKTDKTITNLTDNYSHRSEKASEDFVTIVDKVQKHLSELLPDVYAREKTEEDTAKLRSCLRDFVTQNNIRLDGKTVEQTIALVDRAILGWDILDEELNENNSDIEEIQIQDFNDIHVIKKGKRVRLPQQFSSPAHLRSFVDRLVTQASKHQVAVPTLSEKNPFIRVRIGKFTRVSIMGGGIARRTPGTFEGEVIHVCIRKQKPKPFTVQDLINWGSISEYGALLMKYVFKYGGSVCAFGGTNTGKTSSLRAFFNYIPNDTRIITIAETDEMNLRVLDEREFIDNPEQPGTKMKNPMYMRGINTVCMWEAANMEQEIMPGKKSFVGLVNASLTFTPEFQILQESKGGEIKDVIESGISGCQVATTIHVNSPEFVPMRILLMYQQSGTSISDNIILDQVPAAFPVLMQFKKYRDSTRKVADISELLGYDEDKKPILRPLLQFVITSNVMKDGKLIITGTHKAIFDPTKGRIFKILRDNGLLDSEVEELRKAYIKNMPSSDEYKRFVAEYNLPNEENVLSEIKNS